ncbi:MAG: hypothetical protein M3384_10675 [Acidobacteriota bacterium]|nr:hypothetical protein [Acidobacteriota bacterium]
MKQDSLHIEFERLTDFVVGPLSDTEKSEIKMHLRVCQDCAMRKRQLEKIIGVMQSDRMEEVPSNIIENVLDLFRKKKSALGKPVLLKRISAVNGNENSLVMSAFGLRSEQPETELQMWFTADDAEINLLMRQTGETWNVVGQVFCSFIGGEAILQSEETESKVEISDLNEFSFTEIPIGTYKSILCFANTEIEIAEIKIGL